jgi:hypothetical protein
MGLFKSMKDMKELTKQGKQLQAQKQAEQGYKPGLRGQMAQMGDMVSQANEQLKDMTDSDGDRARILAEGLSGEGEIVGMGTPERGAAMYNLDIDLEVTAGGRAPYRVANMYMVPASAQLGIGVKLPVKVDPNDQAKIAIDWDSMASGPARGEVRPAG